MFIRFDLFPTALDQLKDPEKDRRVKIDHRCSTERRDCLSSNITIDKGLQLRDLVCEVKAASL